MDMAARTCIVSREIREPDELIRFVAGPDGQVVPDLKRNLPGRGVWVTRSRELVDQAASKGAFARGLKTNVKSTAELGALVDDLMRQAALGALGFARKAGECITGSGKVESALANGKTIGLLHAVDGAEDGLRKLSQALHRHGLEDNSGKRASPQIWRVFSSEEMNLALGATNVIHAALIRGGAARNCLQRIAELSAYRDIDSSKAMKSHNHDGETR